MLCEATVCPRSRRILRRCFNIWLKQILQYLEILAIPWKSNFITEMWVCEWSSQPLYLFCESGLISENKIPQKVDWSKSVGCSPQRGWSRKVDPCKPRLKVDEANFNIAPKPQLQIWTSFISWIAHFKLLQGQDASFLIFADENRRSVIVLMPVLDLEF